MLTKIAILSSFAILLFAACTTPQSLPAGHTQIPTLIPATEPSSPLTETALPSFPIQSYPARLPSAELGQPIYQKHCASCHGEDGNGIVPGARNFGDLDYMRGETPASFYTTITEGRGEMQGFREPLTSDERWDVVFYVWQFSTDFDRLSTGHQIYESDCQICHGQDGNGEVLGAADFSDLRVVDDQAPRDYYLVTTQGKGSMPAWQGRLSQDERWSVIDYIRTFSYQPNFPEEQAVLPTQTDVAEIYECDPEYLDQSNPLDWNDPAASIAGQLIYDRACGMCHGVDGSGNLPGTPDYTDPEVAQDLRTNSGEKLCIVASGTESMPGWKETLSVEQMWEVLTYLNSFSK